VEGSPLVFALLGVAFAGVSVHLIVYARRRGALLRRFAQSRGLHLEARDDGSLEHQLCRAFEIEDSGCARSFGQIRDIVSLPQGVLFRVVELSDLNPHASVESSHHARAAVLFSGDPGWSGIFHVSADLGVHQRYPRERGAAEIGVRGLFEQAGIAPPPHTLSLTFMRGCGLAYLEPAITGSVTEAHLTYLADLAARLSVALGDASSRGTARVDASPENAGVV
jgi:hypothetical protein